MRKETLVALAFAGVALVCLQFSRVDDARSDVPDFCTSQATAAPGVVIACPGGDGEKLETNGLTITVTVRHYDGRPFEGIPAMDIWLIGCNELLSLCGGAAAISASGPTDANGVTTITDDIAAGGCDVGGVRVVVQGIVIGGGACNQPCVPVKVKSADLVPVGGNLVVDLADFSKFGTGYQSPPRAYQECLDYVAPFGEVKLNDYAKFSTHYIGAHHC